jgi:hypothetical protein
MDRRAAAAYDAALSLAADSAWGDEPAVDELRRVAKDHQDALRVAETNVRADPYFGELSIQDRAQRLLHSAMTGEPVRAHLRADTERIEKITSFSELPEQDAWSYLVLAVPDLQTFADRAALGEYAFPRELGPKGSAGDRRHERLRAYTQRVQDLGDALSKRLGPNSPSTDVICRSQYALWFAQEYLLSPQRTGVSEG